MPTDHTTDPSQRAYVVASHLSIDPEGADTLEDAFRDRLGEVDDAEGFLRLEVWRDTSEPGRYTMVSWWDSEHAFRAYMGSDAHRRSHARIPHDPHRPRAVAVDRYEIVAT